MTLNQKKKERQYELNKCAVVYINGEKQNDADASCNPVADNNNKNEPSEVVNVHATSA